MRSTDPEIWTSYSHYNKLPNWKSYLNMNSRNVAHVVRINFWECIQTQIRPHVHLRKIFKPKLPSHTRPTQAFPGAINFSPLSEQKNRININIWLLRYKLRTPFTDRTTIPTIQNSSKMHDPLSSQIGKTHLLEIKWKEMQPYRIHAQISFTLKFSWKNPMK